MGEVEAGALGSQELPPTTLTARACVVSFGLIGEDSRFCPGALLRMRIVQSSATRFVELLGPLVRKRECSHP